MALRLEAPPSPPVAHGLARLAAALAEVGIAVRHGGGGAVDGEAIQLVVATTERAQVAKELAGRAGLALPVAAESVAFGAVPAAAERAAAILLVGGDVRGLAYALLEAARRVELAELPRTAGEEETVAALLALFPASAEVPERQHRSVCVFPHHPELDREWYRSPEFWAWYFDQLVLHRFNRFSLIYGLQTAYMAPPYPHFVEVPEHPEVTVPGLTREARDENLELLRTISRLAVERGLDFTLGVWQQNAHTYGESQVAGLGKENMESFSAAGLRRLLEAVPGISGLQLRVNAESGIHLDEGAAFWRRLYEGVVACGRPIRLELRAKAIVDDTIAAAVETGLPVSVNTKFWMEHQGLPYHATQLQDGDRFVRRHSYGDQLRYPRDYGFIFQLWNLGTNKLFLWSDPEWVRRFAASTTLAGADGFEVCAPLSNKGFQGQGGVWRIFKDRTYEHYRWEQERYWSWYALFGRLGYSGQADPEAWQREWRLRFGPAAGAAERALREASRVLPLVTASHAPTASVFTYWPEKDMGGVLDLYAQVEPSDVAMFASVEQSVEEEVSGQHTARRTAGQVASALTALAEAAEGALGAALGAAPPDVSESPELRGLAVDVRMQAQLARYHAAKRRAAAELTFFRATGDADALPAAREAAREAVAAWKDLVAVADGVYEDDLIFGTAGEQQGHWRDHLAYAEWDVARVEGVAALFDRYGRFDLAFDFGAERGPRRSTPPQPYLDDYALEHGFIAVGPKSVYERNVGWGWGGTYGKVATAAPVTSGGTLRAARPSPDDLPSEALYADYVSRHPAANYDNATFLVDLENGDYEVAVIMADRSAAPRDHGPMTVTLQGREVVGPVRVEAGDVAEVRRRVRVTNGRLETELNAPPETDWIISGLVVTRVAPHVGHRPPRWLRAGEPWDVRATVTSPEPVRRCVLHVRFAARDPFTRVPMVRREKAEPVHEACVEVPAAARIAEYYIEAMDDSGVHAAWPAEGANAPRRVFVGEEATEPVIRHTPVTLARPGEAIRIEATVRAGAPLARVTLHYRNVNQMQAHERLAMRPVGEGSEEYVAEIPAEHVTVARDVMYHVEAVDVLGNGAFAPGLEAGTPYVVVTVAREASSTG